MKYIVLRSFLKKFDAYDNREQELIIVSLEKIKRYLEIITVCYSTLKKKGAGILFWCILDI